MTSLFLLTVALATTPATAATEATTAKPRVSFETTKGTFVLELDPAKAPKTVANFLAYAESGFYEGTIFHRVIPRFMVQGGGFTADMSQKPTQAKVENEANNGLKNLRGTVAMARTNDPHSATAQFFVNVVDNPPLDHTAKTAAGWGYTVFGQVISGMEVVDAIVAVPRGSRGPFQDVPKDPITITKVTVTK